MYHIVTTAKSAVDAVRDVEAAAKRHGFGVLHTHNLHETLARKGHKLGAQCHILEVCNPRDATEVLRRDMRINMALPCRISVFEEGARTKIGTILPSALLGALSDDAELAAVAARVETAIKAIIAEAAAPADTRTALLQRRAELVREIEAGVAKRAAARDEPLAANVPDSGELAAAGLTLDLSLAEVDRDVGELEAVDAALERLDSGIYGNCVDCGKAIAPERLAASPAAARCVPCQQARERKTAARVAKL